MPEVSTTFDWGALLRLLGLWLVAVLLALRVLDLLFPRLRRDDNEEAPALPPSPPLRPCRRAAASGGAACAGARRASQQQPRDDA